MKGRRYLLPAALASIVALTAVIYLPTLRYGFVYDDRGYIVGNPAVQGGFTPAAVRWAFTSFHQGNWHPVTWLTHIADVRLFRLDAGRHHGLNIALHLANTLLLYVALRRLTGAAWRSLLVAGLFSLHPLRVESVAWVSERKDLLCAFFMSLALLAWLSWLRRPRPARYLAATALYALGLLSKPMVVTFPFVLLLLDWWPLGRLSTRGDFSRSLREKLPLLLLSGLSAVVAFFAQQSGSAVGTLLDYPAGARIANAALAYASYLFLMAWPANLAVFYPHRGEGVALGAALAALSLAAVSVLAWRARRRGYPVVGWCWYLGALVPVIGIVQVGDQALADRYTYIPLTGVLVVLVWGFADLAGAARWRRSACIALAAGILTALGTLSSLQVRSWKDDITLFGHAAAAVPGNWVAYSSLAAALAAEKRYQEALPLFQAALRIYPGHYETLYGYGRLLGSISRPAEGVIHLEKAIERHPERHVAYVYLGFAYVGMRDKPAALAVQRRLAAVNPEQAAKLQAFIDTLP